MKTFLAKISQNDAAEDGFDLPPKDEELNAKINQYLPEELREQCTVGSFNNCCLVLVLRNPEWALQLRYSLPELRDTLRRDAGLHQLASIKITVL